MTPNEQAVQYAYDAYNADMLLSFYVGRVRAILDSGDRTRIKLFCQWLEREQKRMERAA